MRALRRHLGIGAVLGLILLVQCSTSYFVSQQSPTPIVVPEKMETPEYRLGFGDLIEIKFFNNDRFNERVRVRPDGRITLEKVGDLYVAGMTPSHLDSLITEVYAEIILKPDVTVIVREFGGSRIYVLGEVNLPGGYAMQQDMNFLQAIATAGGAKDGAKLSSVMVLRKGKNGVINAFRVDLSRALKGRKIPGNPGISLQPQDVIYVPKTFVANVSTFMKQVYDGLLPPVDAYLRYLFWSRY